MLYKKTLYFSSNTIKNFRYKSRKRIFERILDECEFHKKLYNLRNSIEKRKNFHADDSQSLCQFAHGCLEIESEEDVAGCLFYLARKISEDWGFESYHHSEKTACFTLQYEQETKISNFFKKEKVGKIELVLFDFSILKSKHDL